MYFWLTLREFGRDDGKDEEDVEGGESDQVVNEEDENDVETLDLASKNAKY